MKSVFNYVSGLLASLRPLVIALACALLVFSSAAPAFAFGSTPSRLDKGEEPLDTITKKSEEAISGPMTNANDGESVMKNSQEGLNGVQGAGDTENMISREEAQSKGVTSIETKIKNTLEDITP
ncbi:MAG: hypothetical protein WBB01_14555 [Phormidesmis sp.]